MLPLNNMFNWHWLGIHEVERGEQELQRQRELEAENPPDSDESESGSGLENRVGPGQMAFNTPPDSPNAVSQYLREQSLQYEGKFSKIYQYISTVSGENKWGFCSFYCSCFAGFRVCFEWVLGVYYKD